MATRRPKVPQASRPSSSAPDSTDSVANGESNAEPRLSKVTKSAAPSNKPTSASARNAERNSDAANAPVAARAFSGRLVALVAVLIAVALLLTPSLNTFLQQRADIASLKADIAAKEKQQKDLENQLTRWSDPAYVKQQARDRLNMIQPGETGYWVYGGDQAPATPDQPGTSANPEGLPWVDGLWKSIIRSATE
ncbi:predicted septum formation initiator [Renibacterium salmoninarum ATCC 33209]|uniref:Predicted septum formation initiator n=1 Tax=Renibacterium salmoninarum (strain ATCC 33209 / DSM 20767 / JCM 11484 / NBRC 15589 / NCIMB 2235) TaxID=288705 RepID=A9WKT1_RENSM|nr:septum formation initiator family protein [Renibacterium salmoninarum]ABY22089.1 predicted septum formation initiator [Renibacterium salmoninarum ATCC 33209]